MQGLPGLGASSARCLLRYITPVILLVVGAVLALIFSASHFALIIIVVAVGWGFMAVEKVSRLCMGRKRRF